MMLQEDLFLLIYRCMLLDFCKLIIEAYICFTYVPVIIDQITLLGRYCPGITNTCKWLFIPGIFCLFATCPRSHYPGVEISHFSGLFLSTEETVTLFVYPKPESTRHMNNGRQITGRGLYSFVQYFSFLRCYHIGIFVH